MVQVSAEEAQANLPDLIAAVIRGEEVYITQDGQQVVQLTPMPKAESTEPVSHLPNEEDDPFLSVVGIFSSDSRPITNEEIDLELYGPITVGREKTTRETTDEA